ncbi:polyphosphatase [Martiniozyma asiatica (nom. inval.)]|nr:polyphosphatase [Martiniozyma asiatica]
MSDLEFEKDVSSLNSIYLIDPIMCKTEERNINFFKTQTERKGRSEQVYNKFTYARLVGGCIVLNKTHDKVLMISSSKYKDRWVMPKGGIELDEADNFRKTAMRETWEEAGVIGRILKKLPVVLDHRFLNESQAKDIGEKIDLNVDGVSIPRSEFHFYEMEVEELCKAWPESHKRERKWCSYEEAKHELHKSNRPELLEALNDSEIEKNYVKLKYDEHSNLLLDAELEKDKY